MAQPSAHGLPGGPSLPPLTQPTGEIPKIPAAEAGPDQTVVVPGGHQDEVGVFAEPDTFDGPAPSALDPKLNPFAPPSQMAGGADGYELDHPVEGELGGMNHGVDHTAAMPAMNTDDRDVDADLAAVEAQLAEVRSDTAATDPFPDAAAEVEEEVLAADRGRFSPEGVGRPSDSPVSAMAGAGARQLSPSKSDANRAPGRSMPGASAFEGRPDRGEPLPRGGGRPGRGFDDPADRLQDTEFKLADKRRKQKPKEPNRLLLALAMALVVLVGVGVAWYLTRDSGNDDLATSDETAEVVADAEALPDADDASVEQPIEESAQPQVDEPTLFFDEAQTGPLQQGTTYSIDLVGEPEGSMLQVVVDDIAQGQPDLQLPDLILPAGRHSLHIQMTNGAETTASTPIEVYVLGDAPATGFRANLSSVDIQNEGWVEAIRQYDEYKAAGHEALQLAPLSPGYWNIFVGGLGEDRATVQTYCESFNLAVPDECFAAYFDGAAAPAGDTTDTTAATTETTVEAMTDENGSSTTAAGG